MNSMCKNCMCLNSTCEGTNVSTYTGCVFKKTRNVIGSFQWDNGSINDNIRNILNSKHISYVNTMSGDILVNNEKIQHEIENNTCIVFM